MQRIRRCVGGDGRVGDVLCHQPDDIGARNLAAHVNADPFSVTQDRDPVRHADDFGKAVRDVEHRFSFGTELHHPLDQKFGIRFRQNRGRFVENHDFAGMHERAGDLRQPKVRHAES